MKLFLRWALALRYFIDGAHFVPEAFQEIEPQCVRAVRQGTLRRVVHFHEDAVHTDCDRGSRQGFDELRLAAR